MAIKSIYEIAPILKDIANSSGPIGPALRQQLARWEALTQRLAMTKTANEKPKPSKTLRDLLS